MTQLRTASQPLLPLPDRLCMTAVLLLALPRHLLNRLIKLIAAGLAKHDQPSLERVGYVLALTLVMWLAVKQTSIAIVFNVKIVLVCTLWLLHQAHIQVPAPWLSVVALVLIIWMVAHAPRYYREMMERFRILP